MNKFLVVLLSGIVITGPVVAQEVVDEEEVIEETAGVVERMDCATIKEKISKLLAIETLDEEQSDELDKLQAMNRKSCVARAGGRRTSAKKAMPATEVEEKQEVEEKSVEVVENEQVVVELSAEQIAKNIENGLCADGAKPNKFGCCEGETFKDLGNTVFACCPSDGGDCFPPITK